MRVNWLSELYKKIQTDRNERLRHALSLLNDKATSDPAIAEALDLLRPLLYSEDHDLEIGSTNRPVTKASVGEAKSCVRGLK